MSKCVLKVSKKCPKSVKKGVKVVSKKCPESVQRCPKRSKKYAYVIYEWSFREGGIAVDEYIDAFVVERRRQQEVAERQRRLDAEKAKAEANPEAANDDQDEDNFDLREVIQRSNGHFLKVRQFRNYFFKLMFPPKNKRTNSTLLL